MFKVQVPAGAAGECSSPGSIFCAAHYFCIHSTPVLPQKHVKDPGHSARRSGGRYFTAKHACTLRMGLCMKWHGAWLYGVLRTRRDGSSFLWHQPCQRCNNTTSVYIKKKKRALKKAVHSCRITMERSESAWERWTALYIYIYNSDQ